MPELATRLDDLLAAAVGKVVRRDLAVPVEQRATDYSAASSGAWLFLTVLISLVSLLLLPPTTWSQSTATAAVLSAPAGMCLLRGVYDRARSRYARGGVEFALAVLVAFGGSLAAVQPVA